MKILAFILSVMSFFAFAGETSKTVPILYDYSHIYDYKIIRVIDGDTIQFEMPGLPIELGDKMSLRIFGIDTPEKGFRAKCDGEAKTGQLATDFAQKIVVAAKSKKIILISWDKFGGRVLGDLVLDGKSFRTLMLDSGYAREYHGDAKLSWCK